MHTHPSYATAHDNLADIYTRLASQAYSKALQIDGASPPPPVKLALLRELAPNPAAHCSPCWRPPNRRPTPPR